MVFNETENRPGDKDTVKERSIKKKNHSHKGKGGQEKNAFTRKRIEKVCQEIIFD